jgi:hypothetical protein
MAHEIGHVLLGPNSHSPSGIMRVQWSAEDFKHFRKKDFCFTPEQTTKLRTELRKE